ncbi:glycosyltransferase family 2 protein [Candidatus Oscillochloris fontis]|uniref:glycosyltransferase family 2 protein n=1 Tax=Candidatus Oscillochloris fontis TaxID=2496868 RepID=UPI00101CC5F2|nr:glycosyltransferase family 2 protein [Candidatus Oscillochloris fontis]
MHLPLAHAAPAWAAYARVESAPLPLLRDPHLPLVSVITPSYNQGRYLRTTIESVLTQDYPNLEYLVVDDGSDDESHAILRSYAHEPRLRWLVAGQRSQSNAINMGWARSRGQLLAWLNSDDTYLPGAISTQVHALLRNPGVAAVYADAQYINAAGAPLTRIYARPYSPLALLRLEIPAQPTVFLRREIVAQVGPLSLTRRYSMDSDYWARIAHLAPLLHVPALVATYRLHATSKTVAHTSGFYQEWLDVAEAFFADPRTPSELQRERPAVLADIYAAMANLEAQNGQSAQALRYLAYAWSLARLRPRMLKFPLSLVEHHIPLGLAAHFSAAWGWVHRRQHHHNPVL